MNNVQLVKNKDQKIIFISIIFIVSFTFPLIIFGINDLEEYQLGYFTLGTYLNFPSSYLDGYIDIYGPGVELPIGHFPYFHPTNLFYKFTKLHYFLYVSANLIIQIFFLSKLNKLIFKEFNWIICLIVFSIPNLNYLYSDDWSGAFFLYTTFFPVMYYWIKFLAKEKKIIFYKFILWISFTFINGHIGNHFMQYVFLILLTLFNYKFFFFKKKYFYIGVIILLLITFESFYYTLVEYLKFDDNAKVSTQSDYSIKDYLTSIFLPIKFNEWPLNRNPFYGLIFFIILICFPFYLKSSKKIYYLDRIFIFFFILTISSYTKYFYVISGIWNFRDILNGVSLILIIHYIKEIKNNKTARIFKIFLKLHFVLIFIFFLKNILILDFSQNNFIKYSNDNKLSIRKELENKDISVFEKTYLSPKFNSLVRNKLKQFEIFAVTDLINLNVYPFNGWFKNFALNDLVKSDVKMHSKILSNYKMINNEIFLNTFLIRKIIFFESEIKNINISYSIEKKIRINDDHIVIAKLKNTGIPVQKKEFENFFNSCGKSKKIYCYLNDKNFTLDPKISFERLKPNNYLVTNLNSFPVKFIFPFSTIDKWSSFKNIDKKKFEKFGFVSMNAKEVVNTQYQNKKRMLLKIISIFSFLFLLCFVIFKNETKI